MFLAIVSFCIHPVQFIKDWRLLKKRADSLAENVALIQAEGQQEIIKLLSMAATTIHKGPHDTDATVLRDAANRIENGFQCGDSNTVATVTRVLRVVANIIDTEGDRTMADSNDLKTLDNAAAVIAAALSNSDLIESVTPDSNDQHTGSWAIGFTVHGQLPDSDIKFIVRLEVS